MTALPKLAFRCEASSEIGTGHVMRCLTLANSLSTLFEITFLTSETTVRTVAALRQSDIAISHDEKMPDCDWLIIDHYGLDKEYESAARQWARKILVIDDLANRPHDCDILLDQTYGRAAEDYNALVPHHCRLLMGSQYALLRPEFVALRQRRKATKTQPDRILVSFGGVNPKNSTQLTLNALAHFSAYSLTIDVVTGAHAKNLEEIRALIRKVNKEGSHDITLHIDTPDLAHLMSVSDLCIGAGGSTSWERCALKLPAITLELADNQIQVLDNLAAAGAIENMGPITRVTEEALYKKIGDLMNNPERLAQMGRIAGNICDGRGINRVKTCMIEPVAIKDGEQVSLRPIETEDCQTLYNWQMMPEIRQHARNPDIPSWEEHKAWFSASLDNPNRQIYLIEVNGRNAGMVRIDSDKDSYKNYEVSILIDPQYHRTGTGLAALMLLRKLEPSATFRAFVLKQNIASQKLFEKAGYIIVSDTLNDKWYMSMPNHSKI